MSAIKVFVPCDAAAIACGADSVAEAILSEAGKAGVEIKLVRNGSRGMLWLEPLVEVEADGVRYGFGPVRKRDVAALVAAGLFTAPASVSHDLAIGVVSEHPFLTAQQRLTFARCGITDPRSLDDYLAHGGYKGLARALELGSAGIVAEVTKSGLRGRGGAGFPTGIKWKTVHDAKGTQKYIVCNADEGDSGTFADRMIMEGDPFELIEGMTIAGIAVGATRGYIYCRSEYPHAISTLRAAIGTARANGYLGPKVNGTEFAFELEVREGAGAYVCGEETSLLESLEGKRGLVRAKPPLPAHVGLFGKPTIINNVLSLTAVPHILADGADAMRTTAWAARAARCRSRSPATSSMAACSRPPSASRSAIWSRRSAAVRCRAARSRRFRSVARSAPIFRHLSLIRPSTTRNSPRRTR
ncbi:NADP-reducing hydrogenase subunit HndC [Methylobrevis pamukkalensis]|uniref:NADP-reducing hydrogenase subunit HndC n=1 Tax=Methylobrevis pamukkalensis TaxID=1439726 RepID=A0A1E3H7Q4_9HYPH|nr:NADP-reducing hydrogenase subunit HndC [Methylobrevis pamukkalensis]